ncbi:hypothetical protein Cgig2_026668 [Carnegiea gigantea]|uniref:Annexin n=1 Tax=Carnegiea gigantea TaxID=171969 RepID=A0A9Q1GME5_9CARY|nr:hypothetical protein Cgig2_026668 [Carnegiea gigantea]
MAATLIAPENADPIADAELLRKACQGKVGTMDGEQMKGLISVIGHRNAAQRRMIKEAYESQYNENLIRRLEKELHGDFERAMCWWMLEPFDREGVFANAALKKSDYKVIIELSCIPSAEEQLAFKRAYQARYKHSLEEHVASHFTGDFRNVNLIILTTDQTDEFATDCFQHCQNLVRCLKCAIAAAPSVGEYETEETDKNLAQVEAEILHNCIKDKSYNHDDMIRILTTRSKAQLVTTFYHFKDAYGTPITESLASDDDSHFITALQTAILCIKSPQEYLEMVLSDAIHNHGADKDALTRVVITRAEKDLGEIKELYCKRHSTTLEEAVAKATSGDYKTFILTLLGKEDH